MSKTDDVLLLEKREVIVGEETFEIKPLVRAKYGKLINIFAEMFLNLEEEFLENIENHISELITILSDEALIELYKVVLDKDEKWINNNMTLSQEVELFTVIFELNDVEAIIENFTIIVQKVKKKRQKKNRQKKQ